MRECIACVVISSKTLQRTPYAREGREKSQNTRMARITLNRIVPVTRIQAEEKLKILDHSQPPKSEKLTDNNTYTHGICLRAIHIT